MGVDARALACTQEGRDILRHARVQSTRRDAEADRVALAGLIHRDHAAARNGLLRDDKHVEKQLDPVLRQQQSRQA